MCVGVGVKIIVGGGLFDFDLVSDVGFYWFVVDGG